ncbi:MAG: cupredoxin domain-containing protein [Deltaproteobacteria bacterium]|nr:cupredoxin domain-containing protein [Deltaproteobacteria bacterium]
MSKKHEFFLLYAALALFLLFPALSLSAQPKNPVRVEISPDNIQRVEIHGGSYYFNPDYIIVKVNVPVEFVLKKDRSWLAHDFIMDEKDAGIEIDETFSTEKTVIVRFTPIKTGKFPFYCSKKFVFFKGHRKKGMEGTLEVVD